MSAPAPKTLGASGCLKPHLLWVKNETSVHAPSTTHVGWRVTRPLPTSPGLVLAVSHLLCVQKEATALSGSVFLCRRAGVYTHRHCALMARVLLLSQDQTADTRDTSKKPGQHSPLINPWPLLPTWTWEGPELGCI